MYGNKMNYFHASTQQDFLFFFFNLIQHFEVPSNKRTLAEPVEQRLLMRYLESNQRQEKNMGDSYIGGSSDSTGN
jgi:hypothetical protein